jgi:molecular chaperone HscC
MILGVDLGTTNSLVGVWRGGRAELFPNALGQLLTPSAVSLTAEGEIVIGAAARDRLTAHPAMSAAAFKRAMGTSKVFRLGRRSFSAEELSALVLKSLKADAEAALGHPVDEAVITVPAYFNDAQRKATKLAGELAGLKVERLLNEPTAAALAYGLEDAAEGAIVVVDLGGGTFDVSVLERFDGIVEVRATAGDNFLGGEDFASAVIDAFLADMERSEPGIRGSGDRSFLALLHDRAELAKRALSTADETTLRIPYGDRELSWTLTRERFETIVEPLLLRLRAPIERALRDAQIRPETLRQVVLAGGATRMPAVRRMIGRLFQRLPATHVNPDEVVARGAAVQAGLKMRDAALEETVLTDVAPFTLGVESVRLGPGGQILSDGIFTPIIERNTIVPTSRSQVMRTIYDGQRAIRFVIYQGESRRVAENLKLGELTIAVPPNKAGQEGVDVRFTYDVDGLLEVEVTALSTKLREQVVIEGQSGNLTEREKEERLRALSALKIHPREQAENLALIARGEHLYQRTLGSEREQVGRLVTEFLIVLEHQDPREIVAARKRIAAILSSLDHDILT